MSPRNVSLVVMLLLMGTAWGNGEEFRPWSDSTGRFSIRARLLTVSRDLAILEREDGTKVAVEVEKLSPQDRAYLDRLMAENPFKPLQEDSAKQPEIARPSGESPAPTESNSPPPTASSGGESFQPYFLSHSGPLTVNWEIVRPISVNPGVGWQLTLPEVAPLSLQPKTIDLPPKADFFEEVTALAVNPRAGWALVKLANRRPGAQSKLERIVLCDLISGRTAIASLFEPPQTPLAIYCADTSSRRYLLFRRDEFGFGNQDTLFIHSVLPARGGVEGELDSLVSLTALTTWIPYDTKRGVGRDVKWADFPDERTLVTCSGDGRIAIWNLETMHPEASLPAGFGHLPALSPHRQWLAFATRNEVGILDLHKREVIAVQQAPQQLGFPVLAFSPSGQKLACLANRSSIYVWDVATGKLEASFPLPTGLAIQKDAFIFPHDEFLLIGNRYLFHWKSQLLVWEYEDLGPTTTLGDHVCAVVGHRSGNGIESRALVLAHVPHAAALQVLDRALNNPETFAFRKGIPVKIDVSAVPEAGREKVQEILTERLRSMDCKIEPDARVTIVAAVTGPKERTVSYIHSGDYKVKEYQLSLKIVVGNQVLWETSAGGVPFILFLRPGENVGQKLKELTSKPNYEWFKAVAMPQFLPEMPVKGTVALGCGPLPSTDL
jgi:hypothetical protein